jgi:hypothetical protein
MYKKIVPVTKAAHALTKIKPLTGFEFAKDVNLASIMVHEFSRASSIYPIVFLEDTERDLFKPTVLLGFEQGENLFVQDGKWQASYIPAIIRRYPFALAKTEEESRFTICLDEGSNMLSAEEGQPLFDENGEPTEVIERVKQYLGELQQMELFTTEFCKEMAALNMFTPLNLKVRVGAEIKNVSGAYVINEERLNSLSNEKFIELREKKYLPVIYSHLSSLSQIERLISFKNVTPDAAEVKEEDFSEELVN